MFFVGSLILLGCDRFEDIGPEEGETAEIRPASQEDKEMGEANLKFDLDLFRIMHKEEDEDVNVLISPLSIQTAMNITVNGAKGSTKEEILENIHSNRWTVEEINEIQQKWRKLLTDYSGRPVFKEANSFFKDPDRLHAKEDFADTIKEYYGAQKETLDFDDEQHSLELINGWVEEVTDGMIDELVGYIDNNDLAFLVNALYFDVDWKEEFDPDNTSDRAFHYPDDSSDDIPFMQAREEDQMFSSQRGLIALDKLFEDSTFRLTGIMPTEVTLDELVDELNSGYIHGLYNEMNYREANLYLPKMDIGYGEEIDPYLGKIGMEQTFVNRAPDLSAMGSSRRGGGLFISRVDHESVLEIDEEGGEGAAATSEEASKKVKHATKNHLRSSFFLVT